MTSNIELGALRASFAWDERRARRMFWVHFPLFVLHLPLALAIIGLPGAFLFGYFALRFFRRWRNRTPVFEIHEHGFVDRRRGYAERHAFTVLCGYAIVSRSLRLPFPLSFIRMRGMALTARLGGKHFYINEHLSDIRSCITLLQEGIVRQRLPQVRKALENNETVSFGTLTMNNTGLQRGRRTIDWTHIAEIRAATWKVQRRSQPALLIVDRQGQQWDIITRTECTDPAVFLLLCTECLPIAQVDTLIAHFCGLDQYSEETTGSVPPLG